MEGKTYFTILGLLLFQILATVYLGLRAEQWANTLLVAGFFVLLTLIWIFAAPRHKLFSLFLAAIGFAVALLQVIYFTFITLTIWLIVILFFAAVGFFVSLDALHLRRTRPLPLPPKRVVLERELPTKEPASVEVYATPKKKKVVRKKRATKKKAPAKKKTTTKRKRGRPPKKK